MTFSRNTVRRFLTNTALFIATCAGAIPLAHSQKDYPNRPIKLIVPFAPGGSSDGIARLLASALGPKLGQPIVVENRPGAGSQIGHEAVVKSSPDGYTLAFGTADGLAVVPAMKRRPPYSPTKDFTPVSLIARAPFVIVTGTKFEGKTVQDLIAKAKEKDGSLTYGSVGVGSLGHLGVELLQSMAGVSMLHSPYQGGAPLNNAVLTGEVDFAFTTADFAKTYADAGRMKPIAQADVARHPLLPNTPTIGEQGMKGLIVVSWFGVLGPANMPKAIVNRLDREIRALSVDPAFAAQLIQRGARSDYMGPDKFANHISSELAHWTHVVQQTHIPLQDN